MHKHEVKHTHTQLELPIGGFYSRLIHPLTGTTNSGGGGSGGIAPKCFSSFLLWVKFMMRTELWSSVKAPAHYLRSLCSHRHWQNNSRWVSAENKRLCRPFHWCTSQHLKKSTLSLENLKRWHVHFLLHISDTPHVQNSTALIRVLHSSFSDWFIKSNRSTCSYCHWYAFVLLTCSLSHKAGAADPRLLAGFQWAGCYGYLKGMRALGC